MRAKSLFSRRHLRRREERPNNGLQLTARFPYGSSALQPKPVFGDPGARVGVLLFLLHWWRSPRTVEAAAVDYVRSHLVAGEKEKGKRKEKKRGRSSIDSIRQSSCVPFSILCRT